MLLVLRIIIIIIVIKCEKQHLGDDEREDQAAVEDARGGEG